MSNGHIPARNGLKHSGNLAKTNLSNSAKFVKISMKYRYSKKAQVPDKLIIVTA